MIGARFALLVLLVLCASEAHGFTGTTSDMVFTYAGNIVTLSFGPGLPPPASDLTLTLDFLYGDVGRANNCNDFMIQGYMQFADVSMDGTPIGTLMNCNPGDNGYFSNPFNFEDAGYESSPNVGYVATIPQALVAAALADGSVDFAWDFSAQVDNSVGLNEMQITISYLDGVLAGDPHVIGFHGQKFNFSPRAGSISSIVSHADFQINALVESFDVLNVDAMEQRDYVTALGFSLSDGTMLAVRCGGSDPEAPAFTLEVDGEIIPVGNVGQVLSFSSQLRAVVKPAVSMVGYEWHHTTAVLGVSIGSMRLELHMVEMGKRNGQWAATPMRFIDIAAGIFEETESDFTGVLGHTATIVQQERSANGLHHMPGSHEDYEEEDLFSNASTFSLFTAQR